MSIGLTATRNTCFAVMSALEEDFREVIRTCAEEQAGGEIDLLPSDVKIAAERRVGQDRAITPSPVTKLDTELLPFIDFADIAKVIDTRLIKWLPHEIPWLATCSGRLIALTPARNRVCHSRPLEPEDLAQTIDLARFVLSSTSTLGFPRTANTLERLQSDPSFVLTVRIPEYWNADDRSPHNNLPLPEFEETGFLGRNADRNQVLKLLRSHYPVVSVVGEGGLGKTALALRCLYDLLDDPESRYDAIVWSSMKTAALTQSGVSESPRVFRRLKSLRGLSHEQVEQVLTGGP